MKKLAVSGFKGLGSVVVEDLSDLNILIGPNNAGKSSLLQAMPFVDDPTIFAPWLGARLGLFSNTLQRDALLSSSLTKIEVDGRRHSYLRKGPAEFEYLIDRTLPGIDSPVREAKGLLTISGPIHSEPYWRRNKMLYVPSDADYVGRPGRLEELVSNVILKGRLSNLIALLRPLLPRIVDVRILVVYGQSVIYICEEGEVVWPAASMGDGMKRLVGLASLLADSAPTVIVEEPESHHHPGSMRQMADLLVASLGSQSQIFISTHSIYLLDALLDAASDSGRSPDVRVILLEREGSHSKVTSFKGENIGAKGRRGKVLQALDPRWPG